MVCGFEKPEDVSESWKRQKLVMSEYFIRLYSEETGSLYSGVNIHKLFIAVVMMPVIFCFSSGGCIITVYYMCII
jgi:hypothetical protein